MFAQEIFAQVFDVHCVSHCHPDLRGMCYLQEQGESVMNYTQNELCCYMVLIICVLHYGYSNASTHKVMTDSGDVQQSVDPGGQLHH